MNILPFLSSLFISAAAAATHSCDFLDSNSVHIGGSEDKHIQLMPIEDRRINAVKMGSFWQQSEKDYRGGIRSFSGGSAVDLGMDGVPVLDQGAYGTCVTFASTAALDARIGKGDYISQQCSLALSQGLSNNYWDGAYYPGQIIDPLRDNGVVEQSKCPDRYPSRYASVSVQDYKNLADAEASAAVAAVTYSYSPSANLEGVKKALRSGSRVLTGFLLQGSSSQAVQGLMSMP